MLDTNARETWPTPPGPALPLLLLPGTLCDARLFQPMLDWIGIRGTTVPLTGASDTARMAQRVIASAPQRFVLAGFSLGALVALEIMALAPERVAGLVLIGCNPGVLSTESAAARAALTRETFIATQVPARAREMAASFGTEDFTAQTAMTLSRPDNRPRLGQIRVPVLLVCGADDTICPPQLSREMAAAIPHSELAIITNSGHYVPLEQPAAVAALLKSWLSRLSNSAVSEEHI